MQILSIINEEQYEEVRSAINEVLEEAKEEAAGLDDEVYAGALEDLGNSLEEIDKVSPPIEKYLRMGALIKGMDALRQNNFEGIPWGMGGNENDKLTKPSEFFVIDLVFETGMNLQVASGSYDAFVKTAREDVVEGCKTMLDSAADLEEQSPFGKAIGVMVYGSKGVIYLCDGELNEMNIEDFDAHVKFAAAQWEMDQGFDSESIN